MKEYRRELFYGITIMIMIAVIGFGLNYSVDYTGIVNENRSYEKARVTEVVSEEIDPNEEGITRGVQELLVEMRSGEYKGEIVEVSNSMYVTHSIYAQEGMNVIICADVSSTGDTALFTLFNYDRTTTIYIILAVFVAVFVLVGGWKGLKSCFSLLFTFVMLIFLLIPMISAGISPVAATALVMVIVIVVSLLALLGFTRKAVISIVSTSLGVGLCCIVFLIISAALRINGYNTEEVETLVVIAQNIELQIKDLLFAGVMISTLGAMMDVSVSIASSISEIHELNPELSRNELFRSGLRVGRDITGTMANTLILAFAGTFFITLYLFRIYSVGYNHFMNMDSIAIEIAQAASGTIALALVAPLTAYLGAYIQKKD